MEEAVKFKRELLEKEYGSNIRKLSEFVANIPDRKERTEKAKLLIDLVEKLNPSLKYAENAKEKVWGDVYLMSGEKLDVDVDFEKPDLRKFLEKPEKVPYNQEKPTFRHYGRNIELLIEKLGNEPNSEVIDGALEGMGKLMKTFYRNWNKEGIDDAVIANQMEKLSHGKLKVSHDKLGEDMNFDSQKSKKDYSNTSNRNKGKGKGLRNPKRRRN